jgi:hypothetical protein
MWQMCVGFRFMKKMMIAPDNAAVFKKEAEALKNDCKDYKNQDFKDYQ